MKVDALRRRSFLGSACGTLGLLSLAGGGVAAAEPPAVPARKVPPELQATRDKLLAEMEANRGIGVPRSDGEFLRLMVNATAAKKVLEVGTYRGYSGIWIGIGLEETGGRLVTIELDPERVKESRGNFEKAGLADRITNLQGDGHAVAKTVEGPLDLAFVDAEKGNETDYFKTIFPKLRPGGFLLVHNAITSKRAMQPYFDMLDKNPEVIHVILSLSMRDGFSVAFRKRPLPA